MLMVNIMMKEKELFDKIFSLDKYTVLLKNNEIFCANGVEIYETDNSIIWLINPNKTEINLKFLEKIDNKNFLSTDIDGMWAFIIKDKSSNTFKVCSSLNNEYCWYYSDNNNLIISNNIFLVSYYSGLSELDLVSVSCFLFLECVENGFTFIKKIYKNFGGDIILLNNRKLEIVKLNLEKAFRFDNSISDKNIIFETYFSSIKKFIHNRKIQVALTSGSDSRAVLAGVLYNTSDFKIFTGVSSTVLKRDVKIPSRIAKILGIEHIKIDASKKTIENIIDEVLFDVGLQTSCEYMSSNWILYYLEYIEKFNFFEDTSRLMGYELLKPRINYISLSLKKLNMLKKSYKDQVMDRIVTDYNNLLSISNKYVDNLYDLRNKYPNWAGVNTRAYSQYYPIYNPLADINTLKLSFRFSGGFRALNFHENIYNFLPDNIKLIPINYSKMISKFIKFYRKYINSPKDYNYHLKPEFLKNTLNLDLINEIIPINQVIKMINQYDKRGLHRLMLHNLNSVSYFNKILQIIKGKL